MLITFSLIPGEADATEDDVYSQACSMLHHLLVLQIVIQCIVLFLRAPYHIILTVAFAHGPDVKLISQTWKSDQKITDPPRPSVVWTPQHPRLRDQLNSLRFMGFRKTDWTASINFEIGILGFTPPSPGVKPKELSCSLRGCESCYHGGLSRGILPSASRYLRAAVFILLILYWF